MLFVLFHGKIMYKFSYLAAISWSTLLINRAFIKCVIIVKLLNATSDSTQCFSLHDASCGISSDYV